MSEVKGTLLTIILVLTVFGAVFAIITESITVKAKEVGGKIEDAGEVAAAQAAPAAPAGANALTYTY